MRSENGHADALPEEKTAEENEGGDGQTVVGRFSLGMSG